MKLWWRAVSSEISGPRALSFLQMWLNSSAVCEAGDDLILCLYREVFN